MVVEIRISKIREMRFQLTFSFLGFKVVNKRTMNLSLCSNLNFDFQTLTLKMADYF